MPEPRRRQNIPYPENGVFNKSWNWVNESGSEAPAAPAAPAAPEAPAAPAAPSLAQNGDIGDKKIKEHVHGFASADRNVLPEPWRRQNVAYPDNGVFNPSW